jgi:3-hydroxyisobutyrate dehydrogenase-like beta-hydroxyacid dehydrogenase
MSKTIGVLGLGIMGAAIARNAAKAGFRVVVHNRTRSRADSLLAAGLEWAESPRLLAEKSDAIVLMVTGPAAVDALLAGSEGVLAAQVAGKVLIQMSTVDVATTMRCAEEAQARGMSFIDAPVTGSKKQVEAAELIVLAGAREDLLNEWRDFFAAVAKTVVRAGEVGRGTALKLCMNLVVAQMSTALCEAVRLAHAQGVNPALVFEVLRIAPALNCLYYDIKQAPLLRGDFSPAFSLANMFKDVNFMVAAAEEHGLELPVIKAVHGLMAHAMKAGLGDEDLTAMVKVLS